MVKYLLVEDERFAYEELKRMMQRLRPSWQLAGWAESVEQAVLLLRQGSLDLMIVDIRLSDGLSFEIFEQCPVDLPVIFTTAYDEYAIKAFKVNSIDYLLKPIEESPRSSLVQVRAQQCPPFCGSRISATGTRLLGSQQEKPFSGAGGRYLPLRRNSGCRFLL